MAIVVNETVTGTATTGTTVSNTAFGTAPSTAELIIACLGSTEGSGWTGGAFNSGKNVWLSVQQSATNADCAILAAWGDGATKTFTFTTTAGAGTEGLCLRLYRVSGLAGPASVELKTTITSAAGTLTSAPFTPGTSQQASELWVAAVSPANNTTWTPSAPTATNGFTADAIITAAGSARWDALITATKVVSAAGSTSTTLGWTTAAARYDGQFVAFAGEVAPVVAPIPPEFILGQYGLNAFPQVTAGSLPTQTGAANGFGLSVGAAAGVAMPQQVPTPIPTEFILAQYGLTQFLLQPRPPSTVAAVVIVNGAANDFQLSVGAAAGVTVVVGGAATVQRAAAKATGVTVVVGGAVTVQRAAAKATGVNVVVGGAVSAQRALPVATGARALSGGANTAQRSQVAAAAVVVCVGAAVWVQRAAGRAGASQVNNGHAVWAERGVTHAASVMTQVSTAATVQHSKMVARGVSVTPNTASALMFDIDSGRSVYRLGTSPLVIELE